jgi:hypothetical protein
MYLWRMKYNDYQNNEKRLRSFTGFSPEQFRELLPYFAEAHEDGQKENYSGKEKKHTLKNAIIITATWLILFVSPSVFGKTHDKKIADTMYSSFLSPCVLYQDTGYQGFRPEGVTVMQPVKKTKGGMPTREEKEYNRKISSFRVRVEHAIGSIKRMRIVKDECRLRANYFVQRIFKTCAALHNFRIKLNPWRY